MSSLQFTNMSSSTETTIIDYNNIKDDTYASTCDKAREYLKQLKNGTYGHNHLIIKIGDYLEYKIIYNTNTNTDTIDQKKFDDFKYKTNLRITDSNFDLDLENKTSSNKSSSYKTILYNIMLCGYLDVDHDPEKWELKHWSSGELCYNLYSIIKTYEKNGFLIDPPCVQLSYFMFKLYAYLESRLHVCLIYPRGTALSSEKLKLDFGNYNGYELPSVIIEYINGNYVVNYEYDDDTYKGIDEKYNEQSDKKCNERIDKEDHSKSQKVINKLFSTSHDVMHEIMRIDRACRERYNRLSK